MFGASVRQSHFDDKVCRHGFTGARDSYRSNTASLEVLHESTVVNASIGSAREKVQTPQNACII